MFRYFNEECDNILTNNKELLMSIYDGYKGKFSNCIAAKVMYVDDFIGLMQEHGFFNEMFSSRYAVILFHFSLMSRVDEISSLDHMQCSFLEFLEAFARVCDLTDSDCIEKDIFKGYNKEDYPLEKKIESALENFSYMKSKKNRRR